VAAMGLLAPVRPEHRNAVRHLALQVGVGQESTNNGR
jgi:hypothetical protein